MSAFDGVKLVSKKKSSDERGSFLKLFDKSLEELRDFDIQQANWVTSKKKHTLRGLHYQTDEFAESKFFSVVAGQIQLVFIDLRPNSRSYLKPGSVVLNSSEVGLMLPRGFATGYCTLENETVVLYFSDNIYNAAYENGIRWDDSFFAIPWMTDKPILSGKDARWPYWSNK